MKFSTHIPWNIYFCFLRYKISPSDSPNTYITCDIQRINDHSQFRQPPALGIIHFTTEYTRFTWTWEKNKYLFSTHTNNPKLCPGLLFNANTYRRKIITLSGDLSRPSSAFRHFSVPSYDNMKSAC